MQTILLSAPYMLPTLDRFRPVFEHYGLKLILPETPGSDLQPVALKKVLFPERLEEDQILAFAGKFDGAICGDDRYTATVLEACAPRLKVISKWGTGIDSIDQVAAARLGIKICRTPNAFTLPVADSVMGYILAFARRQPWMDRAMKDGQWEKLSGRSLSECTLGVIGLGNCGKAVLRRARTFGMKLLGNDIIEIAPDFILENQIEMTSLPDLLSRTDFVSLNCDLNPTSYHLINAESLNCIQPGAVLINTARGPIVHETALIAAIQNGRLGGAALDVFEHEPLPHDSPLLDMNNVMLAPHNANSSPAAWERVHWNTIRNLLDGLGISSQDSPEYNRPELKI